MIKTYIFVHYLTGCISEDVHATSLKEAEDKGYSKGWRLFTISK